MTSLTELPRRRPGQRVLAIPEPRPIERAYANSLLSEVLAPLEAVVEEGLLLRLRDLADGAGIARADEIDWREDRVTDELSKAIGSVRLAYARRTRDMDPEQLAFRFASDEQNAHARGFRRQVMSVLRVDPTKAEPWLVPHLRRHTRENVRLIKSLSDQALDQIEMVVREGFDSGRRVEAIAQDIERRFEVARGRAELIAVDQVGTLHSQLTKLRQEDLGVRRYRWRSARDERVRGNPTGLHPHARHSHWAREGKIFRWDKPPADGHPGEPIRCRCYAEPVFDGALARRPIEAPGVRAPGRADPPPVPSPAESPMRRHPLRRRLGRRYVQDDTAPREPFDRERLERTIDPIREVLDGRRASLSQDEQTALRRELNTILAEEGLVSRDIFDDQPLRGMFVVTPLDFGVRAQHWFNGRIDVATGVARDLVSRDAVRRSTAIRTLIHETTHAHSPIRPGAYIGAGQVLEEASVEITARHAMLKRFGTGPYAHGDPWTVPGSYDSFVNALRRAVSEALGGIDNDAASARTLQAVLSMRSYAGPRFATADAYVRHFGLQFPEAQQAMRNAATQARRRLPRARSEVERAARRRAIEDARQNALDDFVAPITRVLLEAVL